jgi:Helix-turn-helix.
LGEIALTVGDRIKEQRKEKKLTLRKLSERSGISISYLSDIEQNRRRPSLDRLTDIALGLGVSVSYLLGEQTKDAGSKPEIYSLADKSVHFREVLEKLDDFDFWEEKDQEELLTYLQIKKKIRDSELY